MAAYRRVFGFVYLRFITVVKHLIAERISSHRVCRYSKDWNVTISRRVNYGTFPKPEMERFCKHVSTYNLISLLFIVCQCQSRESDNRDFAHCWRAFDMSNKYYLLTYLVSLNASSCVAYEQKCTALYPHHARSIQASVILADLQVINYCQQLYADYTLTDPVG